MKKVKIDIPGVGDVVLEKSNRAKHMNLSLRPFKGVRVAIPRGGSFASAELFVRSKTEWILKHLPKVKAVEDEIVCHRKDRAACRIDRKAARQMLVRRLDELCDQYGFTYNRVFVRNQKTRWGSCSARKNISLNMHLVLLPRELMDYVIMHELVHTRELNHSPAFWKLLEKFVTDAKKMDRELAKYRLYLVS